MARSITPHNDGEFYLDQNGNAHFHIKQCLSSLYPKSFFSVIDANFLDNITFTFEETDAFYRWTSNLAPRIEFNPFKIFSDKPVDEYFDIPFIAYNDGFRLDFPSYPNDQTTYPDLDYTLNALTSINDISIATGSIDGQTPPRINSYTLRTCTVKHHVHLFGPLIFPNGRIEKSDTAPFDMFVDSSLKMSTWASVRYGTTNAIYDYIYMTRRKGATVWNKYIGYSQSAPGYNDPMHEKQGQYYLK